MGSKYSIEQVIVAYEQTGSVWKAAKLLGLCGQSVHERLVKYGYKLENSSFTEEEKKIIIDWYSSKKKKGDLNLDGLAEKIGRSNKHNICRFARSIGLTDRNRQASNDVCEKMGERSRERIKKNGHPRGMLGKKHTQEVCKIISKKSKERYEKVKGTDIDRKRVLKMLETKRKNGTLINPRAKQTWKQGWHIIGDKRIYLRSSWEEHYARLLQLKKECGIIREWDYEPDIFIFDEVMRGARSYTPDFRIMWKDGKIEYHEIKGWMDARSKTKIRRMAKYYPDIRLVIIEKKLYESCIRAQKIAGE